ncbi:hypothetical protein [Comamonas thiooxydans]|nr:hypothetical protein [Comamonas thiooxydans]
MRNQAFTYQASANQAKGQLGPGKVQTHQPVCKQCGSTLHGAYCSDQSCTFSDWPQFVDRDDVRVFATDEVEDKYGIKKHQQTVDSDTDPQGKVKKYAYGSWDHLFGPGKRATNCRIVIDLEESKLIAAQEWTGLKFEDVLSERLEDLSESVIEVNEAHKDLTSWYSVLTDVKPAWADGGNVQEMGGQKTTSDLSSVDDRAFPEVLPGATSLEIQEIMMQDIVGDYDDPEKVPEWKWVENNASFAHVQNGTSGIWEFVLNLACEMKDIPERLRPVILKAQADGMAYLMFHQGT